MKQHRTGEELPAGQACHHSTVSVLGGAEPGSADSAVHRAALDADSHPVLQERRGEARPCKDPAPHLKDPGCFPASNCSSFCLSEDSGATSCPSPGPGPRCHRCCRCRAGGRWERRGAAEGDA